MTNSTRSSVRYVSYAVLAAAIALAVKPERATACASDFEDYIEAYTTFDPTVADEPDGLYYDPSHAGFGGPCPSCAQDAALDDWSTYLGKSVARELWGKILLDASAVDLTTIATALSTNKPAAMPAAYVALVAPRTAAESKRLSSAIAVIRLGRAIEAFSANGDTPPPSELVTTARTGATSADKFIAQRFAFLGLRATFYQRNWKATIAYHQRYAKLLAGPSKDLAWRARYYQAGALMRSGKRALANLELSRVHGYEPLANVAAQDFAPQEEADWRGSLALAKTTAEKVRLWRLVGLKLDGLVAVSEIRKLDPKSDMIPLLLVRELTRVEAGAYDAPRGMTPARSAELAAIEKVTTTVLAGGGDRPWLLELMAGHLAAQRGDIATARARLGRAVAGNPKDPRVVQQAKASLAMGLVASWKMTSAYEDELATTMAAIPASFGRSETLTRTIRTELAHTYAKAGKLADAEYLDPGSVDAAANATAPGTTKPKISWHDPKFIEAMIARGQVTKTPFDKFVIGTSITRSNLEGELAMRALLDGKLAEAARAYLTKQLPSGPLGTDPFVIHIVDCHDCDHDQYATSPWTHASLVKKLAELELKAKVGGEIGAKAALALGNAFYNITWYGNARSFLEATHQSTDRPTQALAWYGKAYANAKSRELRAQAAYLAAKAELGLAITDSQGGSSYSYMEQLPVPAQWFPTLAKFKDTRYYREVLRECGHFARWVQTR